MQFLTLATALGLASAAVALPPPWAGVPGVGATPSSTPSSSSATPTPSSTGTPSAGASASASHSCNYPSGFSLPSDAPFDVPPPWQSGCPGEGEGR